MSKRDLMYSPPSDKALAKPAQTPCEGGAQDGALEYMLVEKRLPPAEPKKFHQTPRGRASFARLVGLL